MPSCMDASVSNVSFLLLVFFYFAAAVNSDWSIGVISQVDEDGEQVVTSSSCMSSDTHLVAMSTIIFNEAPYLDEWVTYHWSIGVGHFYIYDNGSTDDPRATLEPYIAMGIVSLHNWSTHTTYNPGPQGRKPLGSPRRTSAQNQAYAHSLRRYATRSKFLLFLDADEFLFAGDGNAPSAKTTPVCLNWLTRAMSIDR